MKFNHQLNRIPIQLACSLFVGILLLAQAGCTSPQITQALIHVSITAEGKTQQVSVPAGTTAQEAMARAGIIPGTLDRSTPPGYTTLTDGAAIRLIRVKETFDISEVTIPFERQLVQNESLPENQSFELQKGVNGTQEITYRHLFEDGVEVSKSVFKSVVVQEAIPEITMVGVQAPFAPLPIQGRLVYLIAGNAWLMEKTTGNRRPLVTTGDLDGRIFALSPDAEWLLFSRKAPEGVKDQLNSLWVIRASEEGAKPVDLKVKNVILFAGWVPGQTRTVSYSTVEPRSTAPGWQANNDLQVLTFSPTGLITNQKQIVEANSGGIYGWWGTTFAWSNDGTQVAYARPDGIGLVDLTTGKLQTRLGVTPLQTHSNWAWVPGLQWSPNAGVLYTITHPPGSGSIAPEESPVFDMTAILLKGGPTVTIVPQTGMFAYPSPSPAYSGADYLIAYLQAIFPDQSETSRYRLFVMDRDGSNRRSIFPQEGSTGLKPQQIVWSPRIGSNATMVIAIIYNDNIWFVDPLKNQSNPVTGDGLAARIDWK